MTLPSETPKAALAGKNEGIRSADISQARHTKVKRQKPTQAKAKDQIAGKHRASSSKFKPFVSAARKIVNS